MRYERSSGAVPNAGPSKIGVSALKIDTSCSALRNRISHHEPIFKRDLLLDFGELMKLLAWICPSTSAWIRPHCQVAALMRQKP
jgi:hypothetical protein